MQGKAGLPNLNPPATLDLDQASLLTSRTPMRGVEKKLLSPAR
jgi:hypothetical protein